MTYEKQGKNRYFRGWTVKQARTWIRKRFKKTLSAERIRQMFHELGLVRRKPGYVYVRADPIEQNQFIQRLTQRLMEPEVLNGETLVLFFDVATLREHPTVTYVWTEKGVRPQVPTTGGKQQIKVFGAMNFLTGQVRHQEYKKYNSANVIAFLTYLHTCFPNKKILLIWDNSRTHTSQLTRRYLQTNSSWLKVLWLPKYRASTTRSTRTR